MLTDSTSPGLTHLTEEWVPKNSMASFEKYVVQPMIDVGDFSILHSILVQKILNRTEEKNADVAHRSDTGWSSPFYSVLIESNAIADRVHCSASMWSTFHSGLYASIANDHENPTWLKKQALIIVRTRSSTRRTDHRAAWCLPSRRTKSEQGHNWIVHRAQQCD